MYIFIVLICSTKTKMHSIHPKKNQNAFCVSLVCAQSLLISPSLTFSVGVVIHCLPKAISSPLSFFLTSTTTDVNISLSATTFASISTSSCHGHSSIIKVIKISWKHNLDFWGNNFWKHFTSIKKREKMHRKQFS